MSSVIPEDPFGPIKKPASKNLPSANEVNKFHTKADTDSHSGALHHTLGIKHDQSAPGDHIHDGINSRQILEGKSLTGSKASGAALTNLITLLASALGFEDNTSA